MPDLRVIPRMRTMLRRARRPAAVVRAAMLLLALCVHGGAGADDGWVLARHDAARDITVYVRTLPGSSYHGFYAVTQMATSVPVALAVLADVPALPEWIVRMTQARLLRRDADREAWVYGRYHMPYPFLDRDAVLHSRITPEPGGAVVVDTRAVPGFLPEAHRTVRLTNMQSTWRLTPLAGGAVKIELWGQGDPGGYVPPVLFNYNLPDEPAQTFRNLRHMLLRTKYHAHPVRGISADAAQAK
jgi:hypothetical protein